MYISGSLDASRSSGWNAGRLSGIGRLVRNVSYDILGSCTASFCLSRWTKKARNGLDRSGLMRAF
eukprot:scaffold91307_cov37-Attheya_sp.AAC.2